MAGSFDRFNFYRQNHPSVFQASTFDQRDRTLDLVLGRHRPFSHSPQLDFGQTGGDAGLQKQY